ncbi:MAG: TIGR02679 family protein [Actinomycetia bacterium]|nr:TIGR02679 family protein [Actinomycetes bacterium]
MTAGDRAALERLLGVPEMAWLVERVRTRIVAAGGAPLSGVVRLNEPTAAQREAAVKLVGRPKRAASTVRVDLAEVEEILRRGPWPTGLADAVETLSGPVIDHRAERVRAAAAWDRARHGLVASAERFPRLVAWWDSWCADGGLKRAARAEASRTSRETSPVVGAELVRTVACVLDELPASGEPLAVLARRVVGDAHALDESRPLGRLAASVVEAAFQPATTSSGTGGSRREAWAAAGVVLSTVASTVLSLGVPGAAGDNDRSPAARATATALEAMRTARTPMLLTLDQARSGGIGSLAVDGIVHVCENPTVVEVVAERWARASSLAASGAEHPVLVCTSGQPSAAVLELLNHLMESGAQCRYHGDFDWAGLRIARFLSERIPWTPWRYAAADYRAAIRDGAPSLHLSGRPAESPWDPALASVMTERGLAVEEEAVAELLAADVLALPES